MGNDNSNVKKNQMTHPPDDSRSLPLVQRLLKWSAVLFALATLGCHPSPASSTAAPTDTNAFCEMCDASAVTALTDDLFVVGDDEESIMRVYSRSSGKVPIQRLNLTSFLGFSRQDEADIEGTAQIGNRVYWITSHGNNRKGKEQESRQRFFAVEVETNSSRAGTAKVAPVGLPYTRLLDDLLAEPRLRPFNLAAAMNLPPKTAGAINIEALAPAEDGGLLIGFRNPVPNGKALVVPLLNPGDLIAGKSPRFGNPLQLDLGGKGIRSMERWKGGYLIIAGNVDGGGKSALHFWKGNQERPAPVAGGDFEGINPEAISVVRGGGQDKLLVISDDGTRKINGVECKRLKTPSQKFFRAVVLTLPQFID